MMVIRLKEVAESKNITKAQLSTRLGISFSVIRHYWDNDSDYVDLRILDRLCKFLNCEAGDLIKHIKIDSDNVSVP